MGSDNRTSGDRISHVAYNNVLQHLIWTKLHTIVSTAIQDRAEGKAEPLHYNIVVHDNRDLFELYSGMLFRLEKSFQRPDPKRKLLHKPRLHSRERVKGLQAVSERSKIIIVLLAYWIQRTIDCSIRSNLQCLRGIYEMLKRLQKGSRQAFQDTSSNH